MTIKMKDLIKKWWFWAGATLLVLVVSSVVVFQLLFSVPQRNAETEIFVVSASLNQEGLIGRLKDQGLIRSGWAFRLVLGRSGKDEILPGGYRVNKSMNAWKLAKVLSNEPELVWVTIPEGYRKEQIAERLSETLGWDEEQLQDFIQKYTSMDFEHLEGVFFPDTYLIPKDEDGLSVAKRFRNRFEEQFAPYYSEFLKQDIKWTTGLTLASVVQREAAGKDDMPLIAGILWNRLLDDMEIEVDATVQYVRDDVLHYGEARYNTQPLGDYSSDGGWWAPITPEDKDIPSPYNTYRNQGLPPHPICNPGIAAIEAVLNPEETDCLYYLHDSNRQILCAETYQEHLANIEKYLK